jgi:hypothetical protein
MAFSGYGRRDLAGTVCSPSHGDTPIGAGFHRQRHGAVKLPSHVKCALLLAGRDRLIISDDGPHSKGVVAWPVSQKMPTRLRQGGTKKVRRQGPARPPLGR